MNLLHVIVKNLKFLVSGMINHSLEQALSNKGTSSAPWRNVPTILYFIENDN